MKKILKWFFIILISAVYLLFVAKSIMKLPLNSDQAGMLLYSEDILSGNILLSGWYLTGLTFITTDLPFFLLGTAVFGVSLKAYHLAVFLMYTCLLLSALPLVFFGVKDKKISFLYLLAIGLFPTGYALSNTFVHTGVFILMFLSAFVVYRFNEKPSVWKLILLGLLTALSVAGDHMGLILITLPLLVLCIFKKFKKNISVFVSVVSGTIVGFLIEFSYLRFGGAVLNNLSRTSFTEAGLLKYNIQSYIEYFLKLTGGHFFEKEAFTLQTLLFAIKIIIALVGIYVVFKSLKGLFTKKETDIPNCMLSVGFVSVSLLLWLGNFSIDITAGRYISYLPLFLAVLLSRADFKYSISSKALLCFVSVIVLAFSIRGTVNTEPYNRYSELAGYLENENLTNGYGAFWDSHVLTGYSEGRIQVLPVKNTENGVAPRLWFSKAEPYYKQKNTFFVLRTSPEDEQEKI